MTALPATAFSCPRTRTPAQSRGPKHMSDRPTLALPRSDLDVLMATLDVDVIGLIECLVSPGWRLSFGRARAPAIHYNLSGTGRMVVGGFSAFPLVPHTLVITPAKEPFHIEVDDRTPAKTVHVVEAQWDPRFGERIQRFVAGDVDPMVTLICGYFRATYGTSIDLFAGLSTPIVERFEPEDELGSKLQAALAEMSGRQVGMQAITTAILKQVLVTLVRRSLSSTSVWLERFSILSGRWSRHHVGESLCHGLSAEGWLEPIRIHGALSARNRIFANGSAPANADEACSRYACREDIFS